MGSLKVCPHPLFRPTDMLQKDPIPGANVPVHDGSGHLDLDPNVLYVERGKKEGIPTNLAPTCQSMMALKMDIIVSSSNSLMVMVLKWRRKRGLIGLRPPPETYGKGMAAMTERKPASRLKLHSLTS